MQARLRIQLIVMLLLVGIIPILVIASLSVNTIQKELKEELSQDITYYADSFAKQINTEIIYWVNLLDEHVKTDSAIKESLIESNQKFDELGSEEAIYEYIDKKDQEWVSVEKEEITPFMQELLSNEISENLRDKLGYWENTKGHIVFGEIFATNKYGANVFQTGKTSDYNQRDEDWWELGKERDYYLGGIEYDRSADMTSMDIIIRILDDDGNFIGVLKSVLSFDMIQSLVAESSFKDIGLAENMDISLLDHEGIIYFSTNEDHITGENYIVGMSEILANQKGSVVASHVGKNILVGYATFGANEKTVDFDASSKTIDFNGIILIEAEEEEAFAPISDMRYKTSLLTFFFTLAVLLIALVYSNSVTKPIKKLTQNVDTITKGNFDVKLDRSSIFEIQTLTSSLNRILASMKLAILRSGLTKEEMGIGKIIKAKNEAETRFKALFDNARDAIFIADAKTKQLIDCNIAAEKLIGYPRKKILSMHVHQLYPKNLLEDTLDKFKRQIGNEKMIVNTAVLTKDKKLVPVAINTALVKFGGKSYLQGIFRNITQQKKVEQELFESNIKQQEVAQKLREELLRRKVTEQKKEQHIAELNEKTSQLTQLMKKQIEKPKKKKASKNQQRKMK